MTGGIEMNSIDRWQWQLVERVGLADAEAKQQLDALLAFCERHGTDPDALLAAWQSFPELTVRRRHASEAPQLAVESFLVHNGVNIFGDIVCVPGRRPADLATQGPQFVP